MLYEYDSSLNIARESIYQKRQHAISGHRLKLDIINMFYDVAEFVVKKSKELSYAEFVVLIIDTFKNKNNRKGIQATI